MQYKMIAYRKFKLNHVSDSVNQQLEKQEAVWRGCQRLVVGAGACKVYRKMVGQWLVGW